MTTAADAQPAYQAILLTKADGVGTITLNRPEALNEMNNRMVDEIDEALTDLENDAAVRVIVMTGAGRAFSAGRDLKEIGGTSHRTGAAVFARLETIGKPTVAAVNGLCYTGALSMLMCFDLVIASEKAVFADTHTRYGMVHGGGQSQRLRDVIGARKARELIFTCDPIDAAEAQRIGLVNRVVPADTLEEAVRTLAQKMVKNDAEAIKTAKYLINEGQKWGTAVGLELEQREYQRQRRSQTSEIQSQTQTFFDEKSKRKSNG